MIIDILTILVLAPISYLLTSGQKGSIPMNITLVILILAASNIQGAYVGTELVRIHVSALLEGVFGGMLIKRLAAHPVLPAR